MNVYMKNSNVNLSFIVIGRNEGWKLTKCLESIFQTIDFNKLTSFEIIYVDSKSNDDSILRAQKYDGLKIFLLTGNCNAAIGRNIGAKKAKGEVLLFLDGDMELIPDSFSVFYKEGEGIKDPFISGNLIYYYYDKNWQLLNSEGISHYRIETDKRMATVGGVFFIRKKIWENIGGMRDYLKAGEEGDLALRLAKKGILLMRKKDILVNHHTIRYLDSSRMWRNLFSGLIFYGKSCLYRNNLFNKYCWQRIFRHDYSVLLLILSITIFMAFKSLVLCIPYFLIILIKSIKKNNSVVINFSYFIIRDIIILGGFLFYYPNKKKKVTYRQI